MVDHPQIYTTKTLVCSFKATLKTPLHTWPLCFACGKFLRNPPEIRSPPHLCPPHRCCHPPVLSLGVWEPRRSSTSSTFPPSRVWETDNECFPLCLLLLSSFISQDSAAHKRPLIHPDNQLTPTPPSSSLFSSLQTYQQSSSLQSKNRKKNKGKPIGSDRAAFTLLPERRCAQWCTAIFRQSDGMLLWYVSMETNNDFLKNVHHSFRSPAYPKATNVPRSRFSSSCCDVFSPSLSSLQLPDVTFCPSVTEAFFSSRRSDEDQHAGNRPFRSFHHLPLREKLRKSSAPSALLSAGGSAGLQDNNQSLQEKVKITTCLSSTKLKIPRLKLFTDVREHCPVQFRFVQLS